MDTHDGKDNGCNLPVIEREQSTHILEAFQEAVPMQLDKHLISKQSLWNMIQFLPLFLIILVTISGVGVYSWAWATGNIIGETVPMISHMGTYPPQSCFFTLILSFASFGLFMIVVIMHQIILGRYKLQYASLIKYNEKPQMMLNDVTLAFGILSSLGLSLVGDFQTTEMSTWHKAGLAVFVIFGQSYMYCMLLVAPRGGRPSDEGRWMPDKHYWDFFRISRLVISILTSVFIVMFGVFYGLAYNNWIPSSDEASRSKWSPQDGGFYYYRTAACFEITFVISFLLFVATLQRDFYHTTLFDSKNPNKKHYDCFGRRYRHHIAKEDEEVVF